MNVNVTRQYNNCIIIFHTYNIFEAIRILIWELRFFLSFAKRWPESVLVCKNGKNNVNVHLARRFYRAFRARSSRDLLSCARQSTLGKKKRGATLFAKSRRAYRPKGARTTVNSANSANCVIPKKAVDRLDPGPRVVRKTSEEKIAPGAAGGQTRGRGGKEGE